MEGYVMFIRDLLRYIEDVYTIDDVLYIIGKDYHWLLRQIKDELLDHREDFLQGDESYATICGEDDDN